MEPLRAAFNLDFKDDLFSAMLRRMWLRRPGRPFVEPQWDLDKVLDFITSGELNVNTSKYFLIMKCIFLMGIALGFRISEFHSLLRGSRFIQLNNLSVTNLAYASFLTKWNLIYFYFFGEGL